MAPGLIVTIEEGIIKEIEKTMDVWCLGNSDPGYVAPDKYWNKGDDIKAVSFLKKITKSSIRIEAYNGNNY